VIKKIAGVDEDLEDNEGEDDGAEEDAEPTILNPKLVSRFIRMWPRSIFDPPISGEGEAGRRSSIAKGIDALAKPGVYVLYRDDTPFYIGQAKRKLRSRLRQHATSVRSKRSYFWNYFSAFIVENRDHIDEVEAILIAAMPSVVTNSATPRLPKEPMSKPVADQLRRLRQKGQY